MFKLNAARPAPASLKAMLPSPSAASPSRNTYFLDLLNNVGLAAANDGTGITSVTKYTGNSFPTDLALLPLNVTDGAEFASVTLVVGNPNPQSKVTSRVWRSHSQPLHIS